MFMYLQNTIKRWLDSKRQDISDRVRVEYRLLCSGELYNSTGVYTDWRKSMPSRIILTNMAQLFVTSQPFDRYPQELAFTFDCYRTEDSAERISVHYRPDEGVAEEFTDLLSLLARRLICVFRKIYEYQYDKEMLGGAPQYWPFPIHDTKSPKVWPRGHATLIYDGKDRPRFESDMPPPVGVDVGKLKQFLKVFAALEETVVENFINATRLYKTALTFIEDEPAIAYLQLIFCIETVANFAYRDFVPDKTTQIEAKRNVKDLATKYGLKISQAQELALVACKGIPWAKQKFIKFILDHTDDSLFRQDDTLFNLPTSMTPNKEDFEKSLAEIYRMRAKAGHEGQPFPPQVGMGRDGWISVFAVTQWYRDFQQTGKGFVLPPATWFERVVNLALLTYIEKLTGVDKIAAV